MSENPSILSHVSIGTRDLARAVAFYDCVLASLGCQRIMAHEQAVAWGRAYPEFWVNVPLNGEPASCGNGGHVAFFAGSRAEVDAFHRAALAAGPSAPIVTPST